MWLVEGTWCDPGWDVSGTGPCIGVGLGPGPRVGLGLGSGPRVGYVRDSEGGVHVGCPVWDPVWDLVHG